MEDSNLSFHTWYTCMAFMTFSKKGISTMEMQRQLGHTRWKTVWKLMHKIHAGMGKRDSLYQLNGSVEFNKGYFEQAMGEEVILKRRRGSQKQSKVAVLAESTPLEDIETGQVSSQCGYFKMKTLNNHEKTAVNELVGEYIHEKRSFSPIKAQATWTSQTWLKNIYRRNPQKKLLKRLSNGYTLPLVTPNGIYWVFIT